MINYHHDEAVGQSMNIMPESWNQFHLNCLRKLLKIILCIKATDTAVLFWSGLPSIQYSAIESPGQVGWPTCQNAQHTPPQKTFLWWTCRGEALTGWAKEALVTRIVSKHHCLPHWYAFLKHYLLLFTR